MIGWTGLMNSLFQASTSEADIDLAEEGGGAYDVFIKSVYAYLI